MNKELIMKKILPVVIIALYVIGLVMMIFANFSQGLVLWFISTAGGALYLYVKRTEEKKAADAAAIEEESGSEASAADLIEIIHIIEHHGVPAVFTEVNGSVSAASIIEAELGTPAYPLDMAMNSDYFTAMAQNIETLKEALQ